MANNRILGAIFAVLFVGLFTFASSAAFAQVCGDDAEVCEIDIVEAASPDELYEQAEEFYYDDNYKEAEKLYLIAAEQGHVDSQFSLGYMYDEGVGVEADQEKALYWYEKAARQGDYNSSFNIAYKYRHGDNVPQDLDKAIEWFEYGATRGDVDSMASLVTIYEDGEAGKPNAEQAFRWLRSRAQTELDEDNWVSEDVAYRLGYYFETGAGVDKDYRAALYWYNQSEYDPRALLHKGIIFENGGYGVEQDLEQARNLYQEAADAGDAIAADKLKQLPQ